MMEIYKTFVPDGTNMNMDRLCMFLVTGDVTRKAVAVV